MTDKDNQIAILEDGYVGFRDAIVNLSEEAYAETWLGDWTLDDVLAHLAGWFREIAPGFARVARGEPPRPADVNYADVDGWNVRFAAQKKHGQAALDDFDEAFHEYYAAAKSLDAAFYGVDPATGKPRIGNRLLDGAGIHHLAEHRPEVEAWLANRR